MKNVATTSSFLIVATSLLAYPAAEASSAASSVSLNKPNANISEEDSVLQPKKKKKRGRRRDGHSEVHTPSNSTSSVINPQNSTKLLSDQPILQGNKNTTTSKKKKRRRRKSVSTTPTIEITDEKSDDVLLPLPDDGPLPDEVDHDILRGDALLSLPGAVDRNGPDNYSQNEDAEILVEKEERLNCEANANPKSTSQKLDSIHPQNLCDDTPVSWEVSDLKEEETVSSTTETEGFVHQTHTSSREYETTHMAESNDGQTITFTQQRRKSSVKITTRSSAVDNNGRSPAKSSMNKLSKEPKSSSATQSTGRGGECVRRIKREWKDAVQMGIAYDWINRRTVKKKENSKQNDYVRLGPFGKNLLRWHFSILGPSNSAYAKGIYHGRIFLPKDYPGSPPRVQMLTPSGRFVPGEDICLSASNYHPETWTPRWTVLSLVDALRLHMLTAANEIGGVVASDEKRRNYADSSRSWCFPGVADHRRMVQDGIFSTDREDAEPVERDKEDAEPVHIDGGKRHESSFNRSMENVTMTKRTAKAAKPEKKISTSNDAASSSLAFVTVPETKNAGKATTKATKRAPKTNEVPDTTDVKMIRKSLTKRLAVEMLKLPLRVLSILLMLLTMFESKLRSILDSL